MHSCGFQKLKRLLASDSGKIVEKNIERITGADMVEEAFHRDPRSTENGRSAHPLRVAFDISTKAAFQVLRLERGFHVVNLCSIIWLSQLASDQRVWRGSVVAGNLIS
jgi:hypothetical protein